VAPFLAPVQHERAFPVLASLRLLVLRLAGSACSARFALRLATVAARLSASFAAAASRAAVITFSTTPLAISLRSASAAPLPIRLLSLANVPVPPVG
jgi:hypothetical protein